MNPEQTSGQNNGQLPPQNVNQPPQGQAPMVTPHGGDPYDFILNPQKPAKKPLLPAGNGMLQRVLIAGGGLVILIILGVIVSSLLSASSKEETDNFLVIAQQQTELIRVATDGSVHATALTTQNLAQNTQASITSQNNQLLKYLKNNGQKLSAAQLNLKHSKDTDTMLLTAQANNTYDNAFKSIIQADLDSYMAALQKAHKGNPGPKGKALLSSQYDAAVLLKKSSLQ